MNCLIAWCLLVATSGQFQDRTLEKPLTGRRFQQALKPPITLRFEGYPLSKILQDYQRSTKLAILKDRHINPGLLPSIDIKSPSRLTAIQKIAASCDADVEIVDNILFVFPQGPSPNLAGRIASLKKQQSQLRHQLPAKVMSALARKTACQWPRLTQPREFLVQRATSTGLTISNPEAIPHDLWPAANLPACTFATTATLILQQFRLTYELKENAVIQIVPLTE